MPGERESFCQRSVNLRNTCLIGSHSQSIPNERRSCDALPSKQAVAGLHPKYRLLGCSTPGCFPDGPAFFRRFPSMPDVVTSCWKAHCWCVWTFTKVMVHFSLYVGTHVAPTARKPPHLCLECRCSACVNPTICPACRLFPSSVQVLPVVVSSASAMLVLCRWD